MALNAEAKDWEFLHHLAVWLRNRGQYRWAYRLHAFIDRQLESGSELWIHNSFNWADVARRFNNRLHEAQGLVDRAVRAVDVKQNPVLWAAAMHHRARFWRNVGNYDLAEADIDAAAGLLASLRADGQPNREELYVELDRASILALRGRVDQARDSARQAYEWVREWRESHRHRLRSLQLKTFAAHPNWRIARRAFRGRGAR
ncbi:hypothetical protein HY346_01525 [Candidatus Microgenomates bacterium]|nr:hypothetical protein [Candidatus Microgenomates bacterium]